MLHIDLVKLFLYLGATVMCIIAFVAITIASFTTAAIFTVIAIIIALLAGDI